VIKETDCISLTPSEGLAVGLVTPNAGVKRYSSSYRQKPLYVASGGSRAFYAVEQSLTASPAIPALGRRGVDLRW
jgi:hypothetical protein